MGEGGALHQCQVHLFPIKHLYLHNALSYVSFNAYALRLRYGCSMHIESNQISTVRSLVSSLMRMHSCDGCMTLAVCVRVTLRSVHVVIETHMHPIPVVLKPSLWYQQLSNT